MHTKEDLIYPVYVKVLLSFFQFFIFSITLEFSTSTFFLSRIAYFLLYVSLPATTTTNTALATPPVTSALPGHEHAEEAKDQQLELLALVARDLDRRQRGANAHLRHEGAEQAVQGRLVSVVGLVAGLPVKNRKL